MGKVQIKTCLNCGRTFKTHSSKKIYCSKSCMDRYRKKIVERLGQHG